MERMNPYVPPENLPTAAFGNPNEVIVIEGAITRKEARKAMRVLQVRHPIVWVLAGVLVFCALAVLAIAIKNVLQGAPVERYLPIFAATGFFTFFFGFLWLRSELNMRAGRGICEPHKRIIDSAGIATETATTNIQQKWSAFREMTHRDNVVLLFLAGHRRMAIVLARSMFDDDEQWQRFLAVAHQQVHG